MLNIFEILKVIFLGIVEGITEWLPISSTGHMLLVDEYIKMDMSPQFKSVFFYVIQLGAILAVVLLFWKKIFPFQFKNKKESIIKKDIFSMWFKVVVACIPGAVVTILFDDYIEKYLETPFVISLALIIYGIIFIWVEIWNRKRTPNVKTVDDLDYKTALIIGLFQVLSIIPGTSRSGATIIGALIIPSLIGIYYYKRKPIFVGNEGDSGSLQHAAVQTAFAPPRKDAINYCRKCGNRVTHDSVFCNKCGTKIDWN